MTPEQIIKQCDEQILITKQTSIPAEKADIMLLLPGKWGKSDKRKLCKLKGAPVGEIVCDNFGRGLRVMFNAIEVKKFLLKELEKSR